MKAILNRWRSDKLKTTLDIFWLVTVFFSFLKAEILRFRIPGLFTLFPFRVLLPVTTLLYIIWTIREKRNPWKGASFAQRTSYVLCAILAVYSTLSLSWPIDFGFTFPIWVALGFDLIYFFLALELCRDESLFKHTVRCAFVSHLLQIAMGIREVFFGGIFDIRYNTVAFTRFFGKRCQLPNVADGNANDYCMNLVFILALVLLYCAWQGYDKKRSWIPVITIAPIYFLMYAANGRLCLIALVILMMGFALHVLSLGRKKWWILVLPVLLTGFVMFGFRYDPSSPPAQNVPASTESEIVLQEAAPTEEKKTPSPDEVSLKDEFFVVDEETGELRPNTGMSGGIRLSLLLHTWDCFVQSKGMGVGLGNTAQLAKMDLERFGNIYAIHCFLARMSADFGIWFLIPLLLIALKLLQFGTGYVIQGIKKRNWEYAMTGVLYLCALVVYPVASTAAGDAQDSLQMWLFLAGLVLLPMHMLKTEQK